ncbi:MAG: ABC transporter permease [Victivallales bacterium]|nr:ABC transporter permease [Victivallales bacterium]
MKFNLILTFLSGVVLLFIVAPIAGIFLNSSGVELANAATDPEVTDGIMLTLWVSMAAVCFFAVFAVPLSYLLAKKDFPGRKILNGIINIPLVIPHSSAGIAIFGIIARDSLLGKAANKMGFTIMGSPVAIMLAMAFVSLPFLINAARDGFAAVPEKYEKAARNLGATPSRVFFRVSLPLASRSIITGLVMMWARGLSEFGAVVIVAYHPMITPVLIYKRFSDYGLRYARPVAALFIIVCLAVFLILKVVSDSSKRKHNADS